MYESHPIANLFTMLPAQELQHLADDVAAQGLLEPIVLLDGMILDGRNRYAACKLAGVEPSFEYFDGDDALSFVLSKNMHRRHLNESQRAVVAARIATMELGDNKGAHRPAKGSANLHTLPSGEPHIALRKVSQTDAATMLSVSPRSVASVKAIERDAPELIPQIADGNLSIGKAQKQLRIQRTIATEKNAIAQHANTIRWVVTDVQDVAFNCAVVITDPPYGILDELWEPDNLRAFTTDWLSRWNSCGADFIISFWSQGFLFEGRSWFDTSLTNYDYQQLLVWHYPNNKKPSSPQMFKYTWEPIFVYRRKGSDRPVVLSSPEWGDGLNSFDCHIAAVPQSNFNDVNMKQHPAQKPLSALLWLVNAVTQPGELVCDPFCGSGTTGIAAVKLGRCFHGIEIDPSMIEISKGRIATYGL